MKTVILYLDDSKATSAEDDPVDILKLTVDVHQSTITNIMWFKWLLS